MQFESVKLNCVKGIPVDDVKTHTLAQLGFPVDVCMEPDMSNNINLHHYFAKTSMLPFYTFGSLESRYIKALIETRDKNQALESLMMIVGPYDITSEELIAALQSSCVFELSASDAETLIEEFIFIISELLPRQLSDIYYSFDIKPNPAYSIFFDLASEKLNLLKCADESNLLYDQFIGFAENGIKKRFEAGETLISIYQKTCVTKKMIKDAISSMSDETYGSIGIELALFSLSSQYSYSRIGNTEEKTVDFILYKDNKKIFNIVYLPEEELDHINEYEQYTSKLHLDDDLTLIIDYYELYSDYASSIIRKAVKDSKYIETHFEERAKCFKYEQAIRYSNFNYKFAQTAEKCGCYSCGEFFSPQDIKKWHLYEGDTSGYAYCPCCGESTVIMDSQGFEITEAFLEEVDDYITM